MCDYSGRLVAWLVREVGADEDAEMERHVAACEGCRNCAVELERVSGKFKEYCKALAQSKEGRKAVRAAPLSWAAAAAVVLVLIFAVPRRHTVSPVQKPAVAAVAGTSSSPSVTRKTIDKVAARFKAGLNAPRRRTAAYGAGNAACCGPTEVQAQNAAWMAEEPAIQIALPAAAMFPPGAVPEGVNFVVDLSIGTDGSARQVRRQPQTSEFERRASQP
jgi:hypothetical protein